MFTVKIYDGNSHANVLGLFQIHRFQFKGAIYYSNKQCVRVQTQKHLFMFFHLDGNYFQIDYPKPEVRVEEKPRSTGNKLPPFGMYPINLPRL